MNASRYLITILAVTVCLMPVSAATAQTDKVQSASAIAVVDVRALMNESKAAKSIQDQLVKHREKFLADLSKQEQRLREEEQKLATAQGTLDKEAFSQKVKEFEESKLKTRQMVQDQKRELDESVSEATNALRTEIFKVVEKIAEEDGYDLVLTRQNVVVGSQNLNITDEAMKRLDKALSSVKLKVK